MDSSFNHRDTQVHRPNLNQRAELPRLAARARRTKRPDRRARRSLLAPPTLGERVQALMARLRHQSASRPNPK